MDTREAVKRVDMRLNFWGYFILIIIGFTAELGLIAEILYFHHRVSDSNMAGLAMKINLLAMTIIAYVIVTAIRKWKKYY